MAQAATPKNTSPNDSAVAPRKSHWLRNTFLVLLVAIAGLVIAVATRPDSLHVERTAQVNAPPEVVYAIINDLHQWKLWSPYDKRDPEMKVTYDGPESGPGASYAWDGNSDVGAGKMTIVESKPGELVAMKLQFSRPFECNNTVDFKLEPTTEGTRVSWIMDGKSNFISKAMSLVINMDKMVGDDFTQGLANLNVVAQKKVAEAGE